MALTVVDKELVNLFRLMYKTMDEFGSPTGEFSTMIELCKDNYDMKDYKTMPSPHN